MDESAWLAKLGEILSEASGVNVTVEADVLRRLDSEERLEHFSSRMQSAGLLAPGAGRAQVRGFLRVFIANSEARYVPRNVRRMPLAIFRAGEFHSDYDYSRADDPKCAINTSTLGWSAYGEATVHVVPGNHITMLAQPHAGELAIRLVSSLS
jgi:hypothetical protein